MQNLQLVHHLQCQAPLTPVYICLPQIIQHARKRLFARRFIQPGRLKLKLLPRQALHQLRALRRAYLPAPIEGINKKRTRRRFARCHKMTGHAHAVNRQMAALPGGHIQHRKRDRKSAALVNNLVHKTIGRAAVVLCVAAKSLILKKKNPERPRLRSLVRITGNGLCSGVRKVIQLSLIVRNVQIRIGDGPGKLQRSQRHINGLLAHCCFESHGGK